LANDTIKWGLGARDWGLGKKKASRRGAEDAEGRRRKIWGESSLAIIF